MIGQNRLKTVLLNLLNNNELNSTIIEGPTNAGKKTLIKWLQSNTVNSDLLIYENTSMDDIRIAIDNSTNIYSHLFLVFEHLENSFKCQNAVLKLLEEPPINVTIFILTNDKNKLIPTIVNRCSYYKLDKYTREELSYFNNDEVALDIFDSPKDLLDVKEVNLNNLINDCNKIIDCLDRASISNAFNLNKYLDEAENGYKLSLFISTLCYCLLTKYKEINEVTLLNKYKSFKYAINQLDKNEKYFMDCFVLSNYKELNGWKS